jgi:hypothetical protein
MLFSPKLFIFRENLSLKPEFHFWQQKAIIFFKKMLFRRGVKKNSRHEVTGCFLYVIFYQAFCFSKSFMHSTRAIILSFGKAL